MDHFILPLLILIAGLAALLGDRMVVFVEADDRYGAGGAKREIRGEGAGEAAPAHLTPIPQTPAAPHQRATGKPVNASGAYAGSAVTALAETGLSARGRMGRGHGESGHAAGNRATSSMSLSPHALPASILGRRPEPHAHQWPSGIRSRPGACAGADDHAPGSELPAATRLRPAAGPGSSRANPSPPAGRAKARPGQRRWRQHPLIPNRY